ncbi:hypothetical protein VPH35_073169 [Triticum aestivum]|uniref:Uncharacterized protein n=1 Tax=Triticum turgidum subsp. durum TaxID=4567 RepID=A0A9R0WBV8_TRITD|nr:unnamed protein product [Triticum turgidum subsp. durum]
MPCREILLSQGLGSQGKFPMKVAHSRDLPSLSFPLPCSPPPLASPAEEERAALSHAATPTSSRLVGGEGDDDDGSICGLPRHGMGGNGSIRSTQRRHAQGRPRQLQIEAATTNRRS